MYSIVLVVTAVIACFGIYQYKRSIDFRDQVENGYERAFTELVHYVNNLDTTITKAMVANSPTQLSALAADLWRQAAFAQASLGQLPVAHTELDNTARFLSQVGDYTYSLSKKVARGETLSQNETDQLASLGQYAASLNKTLQNMESEMFAGVLRFGQFEKVGNRLTGEDTKTFDEGMTEVESGFSEYAALIYDGPFSQHIQDKESVMTANAPEISSEDAQKKLAEFLGLPDTSAVELTGEGAGRIPTYSFSVKTDNRDREIFSEVTKKGGYVLFVLDNRAPESAELDVPAAALKAREFLESRGILGMHESYYQKEGNTVTINYAYKQGDFVMYTDLIKVKIALDNGEMIGYEAQGYITNHTDQRTLPNISVSEQAARAKVRKDVTINKINYALIPLENGNSVYCYEFVGTLNEKNFLVYINVENGNEERILLLLENEDGTLTI